MVTGVYVIWCKPEKKAYVGESGHVSNRFAHHRFKLRQGTHDIVSLQKDWDKYGEHAFQFRILEEAPSRPEREQLEAEWIVRLDAVSQGYNTALFSTGGGCKRSQATKQKQSEAAKIRNADPEYNKMISDRCKRQHAEGNLVLSPASRQKIANANRGKPMSEEQKQKLRNSALARRDQMIAAAHKSVAVRKDKAITGTGRPRNKFTPVALAGTEDFENLKG